MIACVVDIETTGTDASDQIIEIGSYLIEKGGSPKSAFQALVAPSIPIPPTASAVHHITDEDVRQAASWSHVSATWLSKIADATVMVAHNAKFEMNHLAETTAPRPWVCTYKCAMRSWPEAPGFGNQVLRYWRNPRGLDRRFAGESHRALPDAYVTAFLFRELLSAHPIETLIAWSAEIPMPPALSFGKHKGMLWTDAPDDYLEWIVRKSDMDEDTKAYARHHLDLRKPPPPPMSASSHRYLDIARPIIGQARTPTELVTWWMDERDHRAEYGIAEGSPVYQELVALCSSRKAELLRV